MCACVHVRALRSETHTYAHTHTCTHTYTRKYTHIRTHTRIYVHALHAVDQKMHRRVTYEYVVCVCVCVDVYYVFVCVCVNLPCVRVYKWVVVCVCMNVLCVHIQSHSVTPPIHTSPHHQYTHHHTYGCTVRVNMYVLVSERKREIICV